MLVRLKLERVALRKVMETRGSDYTISGRNVTSVSVAFCRDDDLSNGEYNARRVLNFDATGLQGALDLPIEVDVYTFDDSLTSPVWMHTIPAGVTFNDQLSVLNDFGTAWHPASRMLAEMAFHKSSWETLSLKYRLKQVIKGNLAPIDTAHLLFKG